MQRVILPFIVRFSTSSLVLGLTVVILLISNGAARAEVAVSPEQLIQSYIRQVDSNDTDTTQQQITEMIQLSATDKTFIPLLINALANVSDTTQARIGFALAQIDAAGIPALSALIDAAQRHPNPQVRLGAIYALGYLRDTAIKAVPALIAILRSPDDNSFAAAQSLGLIGQNSAAVAPQVIPALGDRNPAVRRAAAQALALMGGNAKVAIPALVGLLQDQEACQDAMRTLAQLGREAVSTVPILVRLSQNPASPCSGITALGQLSLNDDASVAVLLAAVKSPDDGIRFAAEQSLESITLSTRSISPLVIAGLDDLNTSVRATALEVLETYWPTNPESATKTTLARRILPTLVDLLRDPDRMVRFRSASLLGTIGVEARPAIPSLVELLKDPDPVVRRVTADALGELSVNSTSVISGLTALLGDSEADVRSAASRSLQQLGAEPTRVSASLVAQLRDHTSGVQGEALETLRKMGPAAGSAVPLLIPLLTDSDSSVRLAAIDALAGIGTPAKTAIPALAALRSDPDPMIRISVAFALNTLGSSPTEVIPGLIEALNRGVRLEEAFAVLRAMGANARAAVPAIIGTLKDDPISGPMTLATIGSDAKEIFPELLAALNNENAAIRGNAAVALGMTAAYASSGLNHSQEAVRLSNLDDVLTRLIAALHDPSAYVRAHVASGLGQLRFAINIEPAFPTLRTLLNDPNELVRSIVKDTLRHSGQL
jgi:HEAT repeat protein